MSLIFLERLVVSDYPLSAVDGKSKPEHRRLALLLTEPSIRDYI